MQRHNLDIKRQPISSSQIATKSTSTHLIILNSQILPLLPLLMRNLHEEPTNERHPYVRVKLPLVSGGDKVDVLAFHGALELGADVVGLGEGTG